MMMGGLRSGFTRRSAVRLTSSRGEDVSSEAAPTRKTFQAERCIAHPKRGLALNFISVEKLIGFIPPDDAFSSFQDSLLDGRFPSPSETRVLFLETVDFAAAGSAEGGARWFPRQEVMNENVVNGDPGPA